MDIELQENIERSLSRFEETSLEEINSMNLLNRHDTKFVFDVKLLPQILDKLQSAYKALSIDNIKSFHYENLYFDTPDLMLYKQHHNGKLNRYKIRYRRYLETNACFFEIKQKSNKYKTLKERMPAEDISDVIEGKAYEFIRRQLNVNPEQFNPQLRVNYTRITLLNKHIPEKLTFDTNLFFKNSVRQKALPNLVIAEVKYNRITANPCFFNVMRSAGIISTNLSKYCTGTILTHPDVKYNRFKSKLIFLNKLSD